MKKRSLIPIAVYLIILAGAVFGMHKLISDKAYPVHEDDSIYDLVYNLGSMKTGGSVSKSYHSFAVEVADAKEQLVSFNEEGNRLYCWETIEKWLMEDTNRLEDSQLAALAIVFLELESDWDIVKYISCGYNSSEISPSVLEYTQTETFMELVYILGYYSLPTLDDIFLSDLFLGTSDTKDFSRQMERIQIMLHVVSSAKTISVDATEEPDVVLFDKISEIISQTAT